MPITIRPSIAPDQELDLTAALTAAVAHELWACYGGNEVVNWLEAERFVASLRQSGPPGRSRADGPGPGVGRQSHRSVRASRRVDADRVPGPIPYL